jgi:acetyl-CoA acetyltransferase
MIKLNVLLTEVTEFCIAGIHDLSLDLEKVNVNGGSIAIGHLLGCSGVRISTTLLYEFEKTGMLNMVHTILYNSFFTSL